LLYTFLLVLTLRDGEVNAIKAMRRIKSEGVGAALTNSFLSTSLLTAAALLAILALHTAQEEAGIPTGGLNFADKILEYVSVTYAPLAEEIGFRVSMIGLIAVMVFISYTPMFKEARADLKTVAAGFIYPNKLRAIVKKEVGQDRLKTWLWRAIVGSAAAFGLTHILYGQGWEVGKVSGATLAGFLLGYLYVKHGFPAAALSHWTFNYLSETIDLISTRYVEASYIFWGFLALGALTIVYLAVALLGRLGLGIKFQSERLP
ncbi:MAG: type II CAAX prenyl endopeptidase Rce1 family protein, partial [Candidatus Geothermarchaeales archaeon]